MTLQPNIWQRAYEEYPINKKQIWLNNSGVTPAGRHIAKRMQEYMNLLC